MTLHVVRTDVLLYCLGGLATRDDAPYSAYPTIPAAAMPEIRRLASIPRVHKGEISALAERHGANAASLRTIISQLRTGARAEPAYWRYDCPA